MKPDTGQDARSSEFIEEFHVEIDFTARESTITAADGGGEHAGRC